MTDRELYQMLGGLRADMERAGQDRTEILDWLKSVDGKINTLSLDFAQHQAVAAQTNANVQTQLTATQQKVQCIEKEVRDLKDKVTPVADQVEKMMPVVAGVELTRAKVLTAVSLAGGIISVFAWIIVSFGGTLATWVKHLFKGP